MYDHPIIKKRRDRRQLSRILTHYFDQPAVPGNRRIIALVMSDGDTYPKSSAFIRLISPLTSGPFKDSVYLKLYTDDVTAIDPAASLCIVQRTAFSNEAIAQTFVQNLKNAGIPLVLDTDDAFSHIDPSHPEYETHRHRVEAKDIIVKAADQVWVSTAELARAYRPLNRNTHIVGNSLDDRVWRRDHIDARQVDPAGPLKLLYMGTATHDADLEMIMPALDRLATEKPGSFTLTIVGVAAEAPDRPWLLREYQPRSIYPYFVRWFRRAGPFDIGLSPLVDTPFNRSKSDIKCLDYLAASILPVVSAIEPYQSPDLDEFIVRVNHNVEAWHETLAELIADPAAFRQQAATVLPQAETYIWHKRSATLTAEQLATLLVGVIKAP